MGTPSPPRPQVLSVLGVVSLAGVAQVLCRPYAHERFNRLERASLGATALILYLCCFFLVTGLSDAAKQALSVLIGARLGRAGPTDWRVAMQGQAPVTTGFVCVVHCFGGGPARMPTPYRLALSVPWLLAASALANWSPTEALRCLSVT